LNPKQRFNLNIFYLNFNDTKSLNDIKHKLKMAKRKATKNIDDCVSILDRELNAFSEKRSRISNINDLTQAGDLHQINAQQINSSHSPRCGTIERITLVNFKCHSLFEWDFHNCINFILGSNGSKVFFRN
jgi:hypothetical protein